MTRYDTPPASDGRGGPHPLAGVSQAALDSAVKALQDGLTRDLDTYVLWIEESDVEAVAHAVLAAGLNA